jgi:FAD synthase
MRNKENTFYTKIEWEVIKWEQIWRSMGFPTANIKFDSSLILEEWTYKVNWIIDWKVIAWAWVFLWKDNVFEVHFIDFKWDLYWKRISVVILYKIRDNIKFDDMEELKQEIKKDIEYIKKNPDYVLTFWAFDVIHLWHQFYLEQAKTYWDRLVTIIAKSKNIEKFKWHKALYSEKHRHKELRKTEFSDIVHLWDTSNPLKWLDLYDPRVICLWYDQEWFTDTLNKHIKDNNLNLKVIRIAPFEEWIFKSSILKVNT